MSDTHVPLLVSTHPFQASLVEGALQEAGIPFIQQERHVSPYLGQTTPVGGIEFRVPDDRLQEAKDALCARDIVCEVSDRLLRRTLEEVVVPLLAAQPRDFERLLYLVDINNKETLRALFEQTFALDGGPELLEALFLEMARAGSGRLNVLTRTLAEKDAHRLLSSLDEAFQREEKPGRIALLEVLPELRREAGILKMLAPSLLDEDLEVREAAAEAFFAIKGRDGGYDPAAPGLERERAVDRILHGEA